MSRSVVTFSNRNPTKKCQLYSKQRPKSLFISYLLVEYNSLLLNQKFPHSCLFRIQDCQHIHHHCHSHPHLIHRAARLCNMTTYPMSNHKLMYLKWLLRSKMDLKSIEKKPINSLLIIDVTKIKLS